MRKVFFRVFKHLMALGFIALPFIFNGLAIAQEPGSPASKSQGQISLCSAKDGRLQLKVSQMPLAQALDALADKTNTPIHHSKLPGDLFSVSCTEASIKQALECLLRNKADLILRYSDKQDKAKITEAWVLGTPTQTTAIKPQIPMTAEKDDQENQAIFSKNQPAKAAKADRTEQLLAQAHSVKSSERAKAISDLLAAGRKGDLIVKTTLEQALSDEDAEVRAQAISSLAHREGSAAASAIQQALEDSSADVRLMAVDGITDEADLLQQALNDDDAAIRSLAEIKLELLTRTEKSKR